MVASDGHSYERAAIADVLASQNKKSPLTREVLRPELVPNRALRRRIEQHEEELDKMVEQAVAAQDARAAQEAAGRAQEAARAIAAEAENARLRERLQQIEAAAGPSNANGKRKR